MIFVRHSLLNLQRHSRRTLMIWLILGVGLCTLFLMNSYRLGLYQSLAESFRRLTGDFQIARQGHWDIANDEELILDNALFERVQQTLAPLVERGDLLYTDPVLSFNGIIGTTYKSQVITGTGVLASARNRGPGGQQLIEGQFLDSNTAEEVMLGQTLAGYLNVGEGDWVSILTTTVDGKFVPRSLQVRGIMTSGNTIGDRYLALVPLGFLQETVETDGAEVVQVFRNSRSKKSAALLMRELEQVYRQNNLELEMRTWEELNPLYGQLQRMYDFNFRVMMVIIAILAVFAIFEMMSMSFLERLKELGTLRAVGNTKAQIFQLLLLELLFLAIGGIIAGTLLSFGTGFVLNTLGILYTPPNSTVAYPLYFPLRWSYLFIPSLSLLLVSLISGLWPALAATRLNVVEVLRHE